MLQNETLQPRLTFRQLACCKHTHLAIARATGDWRHTAPVHELSSSSRVVVQLWQLVACSHGGMRLDSDP